MSSPKGLALAETRYECCGCETDVTEAVKRARKEREWGVERVTAGLDDEESVAIASVIVTCPNGHACSFPAE
jgi:hypothetical protein